MEKIEEIRQALTEIYNKSFHLKEPTASLFSEVEVLMLMTDEDPDVILSQYNEREIQMYNYLINEMIKELRKRRIARFNAERIVRNVVNIRKPRPITVQTDRNDCNHSKVMPSFKIQEDLSNLTISPEKPPAMDQRYHTSAFDLRANDHRQTSPISTAPTPRFETFKDERSSATMQKTSEMQQSGNLGDVEAPSDLLPPLERIDLPSTEELSSKVRVQFDELEINLPEIPPEDIFIQEFRALFEKIRREKAATDYAERATLRAKHSSTNLKYRDFSRNISPLIRIPDEAHSRRVMSVFSRTKFSISNQIQNLFIKASIQEWYQASSIDVSFNTEFSNLENKPHSTPHYGKQKTKKWTNALPVVKEDQMDVQTAPGELVDLNQIINQSKPSESHQTPPTAKNVQRAGLKLTDSRSPLPIPEDEIESPPPDEIQSPPATEIEEKIPKLSKATYSDMPSNEIFKHHPAKRPKTTEKEYAATEAQNLTEDVIFEQYLKSWGRSFLLSVNETHRDIHFPVDLLKMFGFGTLVHQVLKKLVDSGDNQLNDFLPPTSTRKEAAKRIHILLELRTQNVLDFIVQDGEVTGICIKH